MRPDDDEWISMDLFGKSVLVVGGDRVGKEVASQFDTTIEHTTGTASATCAEYTTESPVGAVILAVDGSQPGDALIDVKLPSLPAASTHLAVVTVPAQPTAGERAFLDRLDRHVDTVVLASGREPADLIDAVSTLASIIRDSGIVNLDLADVETVFQPVRFAALSTGTGPIETPTVAVRDAFNSLPRGIETDSAGGVLVDLVGPPSMSVANINDVVSAVRGRVGPDAHLIWGGAVDPDTADALTVRLVFAGVESVRVAPGDDCPRCETTLSAFTLDDRTMLSCDACGFAGVSVRLRE